MISVIKIFLLVVILLGVILIYDARIITKKFFSFGDQNEGTSGLKIFGFLVVIVASVMFYFI